MALRIHCVKHDFGSELSSNVSHTCPQIKDFDGATPLDAAIEYKSVLNHDAILKCVFLCVFRCEVPLAIVHVQFFGAMANINKSSRTITTSI